MTLTADELLYYLRAGGDTLADHIDTLLARGLSPEDVVGRVRRDPAWSGAVVAIEREADADAAILVRQAESLLRDA